MDIHNFTLQKTKAILASEIQAIILGVIYL